MSETRGKKLRIVGSGLHGKNTNVFLDDVDISGSLRSVTFTAGANAVNTVMLEMLVREVEVDATAEVVDGDADVEDCQ